jgi:exosortase B
MGINSPISLSRSTELPKTGWNHFLIWLPIIAGLIVLYLPSLVDLMRGIWSTDQQAHGPIVLSIACWLIYRKWPDMLHASEGKSVATITGWVIFIIGLLLYIIGRSQDVLLFEIGSVIWLLAAVLLIIRGRDALKAMWFPLFFMLFMIPLPSVVVDAVTMPMKMAVSYVAENVLFWAGYPIARTGVILQIGQYKLLVADACAGLHTLFTLEALGLLYLNIIRHDSLPRNIMLAILIVPISFTANVVRVMVLTLITYHYGDEAGQGFLHGFSGMVLFLTALMLIIGVDSLFQLGVRLHRDRGILKSVS